MAVDDAGAAVARRKIGRMLTSLRGRTKGPDGKPITIEHAATHIERARPTMWRLENGLDTVRVKNHDINGLCDLYDATEEERAELLSLAAVTRIRGWFHPYNDVLPPGFDMYIGLEQAAATIEAYEAERVHGLLQTEEYARAMLQIPSLDGRDRDDAAIERRLNVRLRRQDILTRSDPAPADLTVVLDEAVLHRIAGNPAIMERQLNHLNEVSELPNVTVTVIPFAAGLHQGTVSGAFAVLRFPHGVEPPTVYADGFVGHLMLHKPEQIEGFEATFTAIRSRALDASASRELIHRLAKEHHRA